VLYLHFPNSSSLHGA